MEERLSIAYRPKLLLLFVMWIFSGQVMSTPMQGDTVSEGAFILHKFQQPVGKETYTLIQMQDALHLHSNFRFNDRGSDVPLRARLVLDKTGAPVMFRVQGKTSRSSSIDTEVQVLKNHATIRVNDTKKEVKVNSPYFTISGYAPVSMQMALLQYWKQQNKPASLQVLPTGTVEIKLDGLDTVMVNSRRQTLERYLIKGLVWGNEVLWTDQYGNLVAVITNDAEGDKFEAVQETYLNHLPFLLEKAAHHSMQEMKQGNPAPHPLMALKGANIVDVVKGKKLLNQTILIKDGTIWKIGATGKVSIPAEAYVIDIAGKTVLPGLWDMHAHFQQVEWGPAYLAAGVTTIRDCGNEFGFITSVQHAIDQNQGIGPKILKAGVIDGQGPQALGIIQAKTAEEAQRAVRMYKKSGFEQIKVYSSLKPEILKAVSEEAHKHGLSVTGHVPDGLTVHEAIALGLEQINHYHFLLQSMLSEPKQERVDLNDPAARKTLQLLKDKNVVVDPTLAIYEWITRPLSQPLDAFEPGINHVPEDFKAIFRNTGLPDEQAQQSRALLENGKRIVLAMHQMGIPIVAGTDMLVPGYSLFRELELYNEAGLSPLDAIRTATIVPASVMKMEKVSGSITEGKIADIIILDADPLESIRNIRKVHTVIKRGTIYEPAELRKIIEFKE
ncbi:amidohydrolase family protein [Pontibacter sp. FD36]|uniref:amidohydrolase family protein n=1 Tax=Pontibacter sp. FD36 TaxID=2789860 RepID=UPI0018AC0AD9|nr:amidohydrolase family protein [Pontibacter sp. FD36]MBF8964076.1 amidohydrolase family protein [Pontibacter sp. FD36]